MGYETPDITKRGHGTIATGTITFDAAADVDPATDQITEAGHGLTTGDVFLLNEGGNTAPVGLISGRHYFVIVIDENTFQLAVDHSAAIAELPVDITADGSGNCTLAPVALIKMPKQATYFSVVVDGTNMNVRYCYDFSQDPPIWVAWQAGSVSALTDATFEGAFDYFEIVGDGSFAFAWD